MQLFQKPSITHVSFPEIIPGVVNSEHDLCALSPLGGVRGAESSRSCRCGISPPSLCLPSSASSSDSFAPHHLELLQQLPFIFQRSHFTSIGQDLEVTAVGIWGCFSHSYPVILLISCNCRIIFLGVSDNCREFQCLKSCTGRDGLRLVP